MKSSPITRIAGTDYGSAPANQEVTKDAKGKIPAEFPRMQPVAPAKQTTGYNPALVSGQYAASQMNIPSVTIENESEDPRLTDFKNRCAKYGGQNSPEAAADGCVWSDDAKDPDPIKTTTTIPASTITIPGGSWEGGLEREVKGKSLTSPRARKELRKFTQFVPKAAKDARKAWRFADDAGRKKLLEEAGITDPNAGRRDYVKKMKSNAQTKVTKAHQDILDTQATGASRGKSAGQSFYLRSEALPFAAQTREQQIEQLKSQNANRSSAPSFSSNNNNFSIRSTSDLTRDFDWSSGQFKTRTTAQKKAPSAFKMRGYGNNYNK